MIRSAIIAVCLLGVTPAMAQSTNQIAHKPYDVVREDLMRGGVRPVGLKHKASDFICAGDDICVRYPEVIDCGGTGVRPCEFAYLRARDRTYFIVVTYGEQRLTVQNVRRATGDDIAAIRAMQ